MDKRLTYDEMIGKVRSSTGMILIKIYCATRNEPLFGGTAVTLQENYKKRELGIGWESYSES